MHLEIIFKSKEIPLNHKINSDFITPWCRPLGNILWSPCHSVYCNNKHRTVNIYAVNKDRRISKIPTGWSGRQNWALSQTRLWRKEKLSRELSAENVKLKELEASPLLGPNEVVHGRTLSVDLNLGSHIKTTTKEIGEIQSDWWCHIQAVVKLTVEFSGQLYAILIFFSQNTTYHSIWNHFIMHLTLSSLTWIFLAFILYPLKNEYDIHFKHSIVWGWRKRSVIKNI